MRLVVAVALAVVLAAISPAALLAQSCTAGRGGSTCSISPLRITINIGRATHLTVSPTATPLTPPTASDYNAGYAPTNGPTVTVRSNSPWSVAISAATAVWGAVNTGSEPARTNKPAGDLRWSMSPTGTFTGLSTTPAAVSAGAAATSGTTFALYYRTMYAYALDTPGAYSLQVVFTLTAP